MTTVYVANGYIEPIYNYLLLVFCMDACKQIIFMNGLKRLNTTFKLSH